MSDVVASLTRNFNYVKTDPFLNKVNFKSKNRTKQTL